MKSSSRKIALLIQVNFFALFIHNRRLGICFRVLTLLVWISVIVNSSSQSPIRDVIFNFWQLLQSLQLQCFGLQRLQVLRGTSMPFLCRLIALLVFFSFSFELLIELFFEILDLTGLLEFEAENFPSDVAIYMHSDVEILFIPFVDFFLQEADA